MPKQQWDTIRKKCYKLAGNVCQVCGGRGPAHPVECHEIWHYDDTSHIQKLTGFISLCPACHEVKHIGLAQLRGNFRRAFEQLKKVNNWNDAQASGYINEAWKIWFQRSRYNWQVNIEYIEQYLSQEG